MPDYSSLSTQVDLFKTKVTALSSSTLNSQDLVFLAKALESMGNLLGVNDIVSATSSKVTEIQTASSGAVATVNTAGSTQIVAVNSAGAANVATIQSSIDNYTIYTNMLAPDVPAVLLFTAPTTAATVPEKDAAGLTVKSVKLKLPDERSARRKSYCARYAGQMKMFPKAANDPNSRLRQARKRWKC